MITKVGWHPHLSSRCLATSSGSSARSSRSGSIFIVLFGSACSSDSGNLGDQRLCGLALDGESTTTRPSRWTDGGQPRLAGLSCASSSEPSVSAVIITHDEGERLRRTVHGVPATSPAKRGGRRRRRVNQRRRRVPRAGYAAAPCDRARAARRRPRPEPGRGCLAGGCSSSAMRMSRSGPGGSSGCADSLGTRARAELGRPSRCSETRPPRGTATRSPGRG